MSAEQIQKLEGLVTEIISELRELSAEKDRLSHDTKDLDVLKEKLQAGEKNNREQLQVIARLEKYFQKMEKDKAAIRAKIQNILRALDNIDFV